MYHKPIHLEEDVDPDETLRLAKAEVTAARESKTAGERQRHMAMAIRHFEQLDGRLSKGGFPPSSWTYREGSR